MQASSGRLSTYRFRPVDGHLFSGQKKSISAPFQRLPINSKNVYLLFKRVFDVDLICFRLVPCGSLPYLLIGVVNNLFRFRNGYLLQILMPRFLFRNIIMASGRSPKWSGLFSPWAARRHFDSLTGSCYSPALVARGNAGRGARARPDPFPQLPAAIPAAGML